MPNAYEWYEHQLSVVGGSKKKPKENRRRQKKVKKIGGYQPHEQKVAAKVIKNLEKSV